MCLVHPQKGCDQSLPEFPSGNLCIKAIIRLRDSVPTSASKKSDSSLGFSTQRIIASKLEVCLPSASLGFEAMPLMFVSEDELRKWQCRWFSKKMWWRKEKDYQCIQKPHLLGYSGCCYPFSSSKDDQTLNPFILVFGFFDPFFPTVIILFGNVILCISNSLRNAFVQVLGLPWQKLAYMIQDNLVTNHWKMLPLLPQKKKIPNKV